ncbi:MAG: ABC transporter ATP-binding protein [Granulosicoccus sp.]
MSDTIVSIRNVTKRFGKVEALCDISIDIRQGEIFALLGPSGCGKSTLLRVISGFESPNEGELLLDGKDMTSLPPNKRPINMVFQSYAVFPHMSVEDNVAYGLKMDKVPADERRQRVILALEQVHLTDFAKRKPDQLSGGQRQRVALARALVKRPRVLLLDEPLSALDAKLRDAMRLELVKLQETVGVTFIIVTHDQAEAMAMADRIAVLESGRLRQVATPAELYANPIDRFVADFIGNINDFPVRQISSIDTGVALHADQLGIIEWCNELPACVSPSPDADASLAVRPEHVSLSVRKPTGNQVCVEGVLGDVAFQGQHSIAEIRLPNDESISAIIGNEQALKLPAASEELRIWAHWDVNHMLLLPNKANVS